MRYNKIRKMDVANGPGVRVSIFEQGCPFHCKNCFNPETWDFDAGKEFTKADQERLFSYADKDWIEGLSILGGEPLCASNIDGTTELAKAFKEKYADKTIWLWTGYLYENIINKNVLNYIDVLVDGQYQDDLHDPRLEFRGSSNQRLIDVKESLHQNKIMLRDK